MIVVGTSGWQYESWRDVLYPRAVAKKRWLEHFATQFASVELNNAFYRLPARETFVEWAERTPPGFVMAVKMSRFLTHLKRLRDPAEPVARFLDRSAGLGAKRGPVLLQLPPNLRAEAALLDAALQEFPAGVRVAVEPRHDSWWCREIRDILERRGAALCWADRLSKPVTPLWRTADFGYLRLHEGRQSWSYGRTALTHWIDRITEAYADKDDVYVYFNNDPEAAAVTNAAAFGSLARHRGLSVTRTPRT